MKKSLIAVVIIVIIVAAASGGYALFHKHNTPLASTPSTDSATAVNNTVLLTKTSSSMGQYLVTPSGQPLYTFGGDSGDTSSCSGSCLVSWPAYQDKGSVTGLPSGVGTIKRSDNGEIQFTYNGMPLYTFTEDNNGQVTGNGVSDFSLAKPSSSTSNSSSNSSSGPSSSNSYSW